MVDLGDVQVDLFGRLVRAHLARLRAWTEELGGGFVLVNPLHAVAPKVTQIILNSAFRMFPDSPSAQGKKGEAAKDVELTPEQIDEVLSLVNLAERPDVLSRLLLVRDRS